MRLENTNFDTNSNDEIKKLLQENLSYAKATYEAAEKTRRYILWGQVLGFIKLAIVIVPMVIAYYFLQPYLKTALSTYQDLLGMPASQGSQNSDAKINPEMLKQLQDLQKSGGLKNLEQILKQ